MRALKEGGPVQGKGSFGIEFGLAGDYCRPRWGRLRLVVPFRNEHNLEGLDDARDQPMRIM